MASEKRLILLDHALQVVSENYRSDMPKHELDMLVTTRKRLKSMPTVDAVEVVRCKDCKHWKPIHEHIPYMECNIFCGAYDHGYPTGADDFCSYGERKDNE